MAIVLVTPHSTGPLQNPRNINTTPQYRVFLHFCYDLYGKHITPFKYIAPTTLHVWALCVVGSSYCHIISKFTPVILFPWDRSELINDAGATGSYPASSDWLLCGQWVRALACGHLAAWIGRLGRTKKRARRVPLLWPSFVVWLERWREGQWWCSVFMK